MFVFFPYSSSLIYLTSSKMVLNGNSKNVRFPLTMGNPFRTQDDISRRRKPALNAVRRDMSARDLYLSFTHDDNTRLLFYTVPEHRAKS